MNILPKKSWHVRTKRNIERVRRDEAEAAEREKEQQKRARYAESEARVTALCRKANAQFPVSETKSDDARFNRHPNFFQELEDAEGKQLHATNAEHEREKRDKQEEYEKKIGLLTYLGQGSAEATKTKPWFSESHEKRINLLSVEDEVSDKDKKLKERLDPLNEMNAFVKMKFGKDHIYGAKETNDSKIPTSQNRTQNQRGKKTIEELRAERIERERKERARTQELLRRVSGKGSSQGPEVVLDDRVRSYNSQYNPHLARK